MANKKLIVGIIVGVVVVGTAAGIGYYYYNKNKNKGGNGGGSDDKKGGGGSTSGSDTPTTEERSSSEKLPSDTVVKIGSKGRKVAMYQAWLNWKHGAGLTVDGKFGDSMMKAIRKYVDSTCGIGTTVAGVGVGDTQCDISKNYKVNQAISKDFSHPDFGKYMKSDKGVQKVFNDYK